MAAFSNITWDLGNEYNINRKTPTWVDELGAKVKQWDPYDHLCSAHNVTHRTPHSNWCDMQLIQHWDEGQNTFMLSQRAAQKKTGRIIPQINEEYGYEDLWEKKPGQRSADTRRRCAWEIAMAGCYQTTGETARTGTGAAKNTGGGWVNGRGDDSMVMLRGYRYLAEFFTAFDWWTCRPRNDLVEQQFPCLASEGDRYVIYLPSGGRATIKLSEGKYRAQWFNPRAGEYVDAGVAVAPVWTSPDTTDRKDWVLLLERDDKAVDRKAGPDNWRFFAVSYDATAKKENVRFYLGDAHHVAQPDRSAVYSQGPLGPRTGPLTIGAFNPTLRTGHGDRMFRGLIDDIRVFGSVFDGAGALELKQIRAIQQGK